VWVSVLLMNALLLPWMEWGMQGLRVLLTKRVQADAGHAITRHDSETRQATR
jgi:hypothetical protein